MLVKYIDENTIEMFNGIFITDEEITLENGEKEIVKLVFTNETAKQKAIESGEWFEFVPSEKTGEIAKYELKENKIYEIWEN